MRFNARPRAASTSATLRLDRLLCHRRLVRLSIDNATGILDQPRFKASTNYDNHVGIDTWTKLGINNFETNDQSAFDAGKKLLNPAVEC